MRNYYIDRETGASAVLTKRNTKVKGKWLDKLFVPPESRGQGAAGRLLKKLCDIADAEGITLFLVIVSDNDGGLSDEELEAFYMKHGFVVKSAVAYMRFPKCANINNLSSGLRKTGVIGLNV